MEPTSSLSTILGDIGDFISTVFMCLDDVIDSIVNNPILLVFVCGVPLVGISVGIFNRVIRSN